MATGNSRFENLREELEEHGAAVVSNMLTEEECDAYITQYHQWLAKFGTGFPDNINSIIHNYGVSQADATWNIRLKVKPVFEFLWGTEKLLSSMDGIAIGRPPEISDTRFHTEGENGGTYTLHHDQNGSKVGLHSYQGAVYLEEALEDDWCFMVLKNSHKHHEEFFNTFPSHRSEFRRINAKEKTWFEERGCPLTRISVPKGGMVLWDSRTVHAGALPKRDRANPGRWRYIAFVCMAPAIWANHEDLVEKKKAYNGYLTTRHWPARAASNFRQGKRGTPFDITEHGFIGRSSEARLLAGDLEYDFNDGRSNGIPYTPQFKATKRR